MSTAVTDQTVRGIESAPKQKNNRRYLYQIELSGVKASLQQSAAQCFEETGDTALEQGPLH